MRSYYTLINVNARAFMQYCENSCKSRCGQELGWAIRLVRAASRFCKAEKQGRLAGSGNRKAISCRSARDGMPWRERSSLGRRTLPSGARGLPPQRSATRLALPWSTNKTCFHFRRCPKGGFLVNQDIRDKELPRHPRIASGYAVFQICV